MKGEGAFTSSFNYYRPEIDGLRAIAVSLVLLYHASIEVFGWQIFPAGYIGVDVFFVISGFLITSIIHREMCSNTFSILAFYERRARRILPALFVVLLGTSLAAWLWLMPKPFVEYAYSLLSTILFGANIYFWKYTGLYAAEASELLPLLHMWSLAVEEQFYLIYPPIIFVIVKYGKRFLLPVLLLCFVASLLLAEWASFNAYSANFYLMPTRAWELVLGGLLYWLTPSRMGGRRLNIMFPAIGAALILLYAALCDDTSRHPSLMTLLPVLGTGLIIVFAQKGEPVTRILSSRLFVIVGLLSYSLYLWHQPVFVFFRLLYNRGLSLTETGIAFLTTVCLSLITYYFVECPTRNRAKTSNMAIWTFAAVGSTAFILFSIGIIQSEGYANRFPKAAHILEMLDSGANQPGWNFTPGVEPVTISGTESGKYRLFTVGDSHMNTLNAPIANRLIDLVQFSSFTPLSRGSTFFIKGLDLVDPSKGIASLRNNPAINKERFDIILESKNSIVIIGGKLPYYLSGKPFNNQEGGVVPGRCQRFVVSDGDDLTLVGLDEVKEAFRETVDLLVSNGSRVVLVYPIPEVGWHVPRSLGFGVGNQEEKMPANREESLTTSYEVFKKRVAEAYSVYDAVPDNQNVIRVYPELLFCKDGRCSTHDETYPFYIDSHHLSYVGANMLLDRILAKIDENWNDAPDASQ